jgi:hypothetical protein
MSKFLSLQWFKEQITEVTHKVTEKKITPKVEKALKELENLEEKPYLNSFTINDNFIVILNNGQQLIKQKASESLVNSVRNVTTEQEVVLLMSTEESRKEVEKVNQELKEIELITSNFDILVETGKFEVKEGSVYLKGINRSIPKLLVNRFAEVVENISYFEELENDDNSVFDEDDKDKLDSLSIEYQSLIRFWKKCCLNPNAQSAEDLYTFLEKHNMKIDRHGNFYAYRRVQTIETNNSKELVDFISNAYNKVKAVWKKKPSNFYVHCNMDNGLPYTYTINQSEYSEFNDLGNLETLYLELPNMQENRYTSAHTGKEDYRIGNVISMPRDEGDDNNSVNCSMGFHAASKEYDYSGFGNQDILVIINPQDVLAVPYNEIGKLRTCRWFFAMTLAKNERYILDEECFDVTYLGDVFEDKCLENIQEYTQNSFAEEVKRHSFQLPTISTREISSICKSLEEIKEELSERLIQI